MGKALYRKYRSRSLDEVVGQPQVTELLSRALKQGRIAHAYLFTGPKGVGKTSIARILAHEINKLPYSDESTHLDIIEIDAASNNGVEDIRDLREKVRLAPVSAEKKVYIIDEVHMLSKPAFNALLKTLEEPPEHVVFILATTDIDKVPGTILSRTQRHTFRRASNTDIIKNLQRIAKAEKLQATDDALEVIAQHSDGSFRDSVSLFDQLASLADDKNGVTKELVATSLGLADEQHIKQLISASLVNDISTIVSTMTELEEKGTPAKMILHQLIAAVKSQIASQPNLTRLLDQLIDLHKSSRPELKLLTTLSLFTKPVSLEPTKASSHTVKNTQRTEPDTSVDETQHDIPSKRSDPAAKDISKNDTKAASAKKTKPQTPVTLDWPKLLEHVRTHHVALHSVLAKCEPELAGNTLTLYTRNQFYKKKLDDTKYRSLLMKSLEETSMTELDIETKPTTAPLKDSQAAKVAAMMGGGEEVKLEESRG